MPAESKDQSAPAPVETPLAEIAGAATEIQDGLNRFTTAIPSQIEAWWQDWFPNSPVSRNTDAWNWAYQAKEDLKKKLTK